MSVVLSLRLYFFPSPFFPCLVKVKDKPGIFIPLEPVREMYIFFDCGKKEGRKRGKGGKEGRKEGRKE